MFFSDIIGTLLFLVLIGLTLLVPLGIVYWIVRLAVRDRG